MEEVSLPSASQDEYKSALIGHIQPISCIGNAWGKKSTEGIREGPESFCSCDWVVQAQFLAVFLETE